MEIEKQTKTISNQREQINLLKQKILENKREYDEKTKNLMNSISNLEKDKEELTKLSKDNYRVKIINDLKKERKDQEQVITLLRKYVNNNKEIDKYLLNEFSKNGDQRLATYEELKIKCNHLESELTKLKLKLKKAPTKTINNTLIIQNNNSYMGGGEEESNPKQTGKLSEYHAQICELERENIRLKESKEKMEHIQNEFLERFKLHNIEMENIKAIYDQTVKEVELDAADKLKNLSAKIKSLEKEKEKLNKKINELIEINRKQKQGLNETMIKLQRDNDIYVKLLDNKKQEVEVYKKSMDEIISQLDKYDSKEANKFKRIEKERDTMSKDKFELENKVDELQHKLEQKELEFKNAKNNFEREKKALSYEIEEKNYQLIILNERIIDLEKKLQELSK